METLPRGLVSTSVGAPSRLEGSARVDEGNIAKLWKVYGTNAPINKDDVGTRLENFFWRVWGNTRLLKSLEGSVLARLFTSIMAANPVSSPESALLELKKLAFEPAMSYKEGDTYKEGEDYVQYGHSSILKKYNAATNGMPLHKRTRIFIGGLGPKQIRHPSSPLTPGSPPPFAAIPGDAAGDDADGDDAAGDLGSEGSNSGDSDSESSDSDGSGSDGSDSGGSVAGEPPAEDLGARDTATENLTSGSWTGGGRGNRYGHRRTATIPQHPHKRLPFFVASMMARRRPMMRRRKSSKAAGPSKLRSEVRFDSEDVSAEDSKQTQVQTEDQEEDKPVETSKSPLEESKTEAEARVPEQKEAGLGDADQKPKDETAMAGTTMAADVMSNLKHILTESAIRTSSRAHPGQAFNCVSTRRHPQGARSMPIKLVDDHFRLRFAQEIQREENMLKEIDSLPEQERKAVQAQSISALTGLLPPKKPEMTWVVVSDEEAEREVAEAAALKASNDTVSSSSSNDNEWFATSPSAIDHSNLASDWTDGYMQDSSPNMQVDAAPQIEGMSYVSSVRAANRLHAPGQLSVLLRAQQYGHCNGGELYPE